jgi:hypothetical protein
LKIAMLDPEEKFESPKTDPSPKALPQKEELALMVDFRKLRSFKHS